MLALYQYQKSFYLGKLDDGNKQTPADYTKFDFHNHYLTDEQKVTWPWHCKKKYGS